MGTTNKLWHEQHRMAQNPTAEQRIEWHIAHAANCGCRPIPKGVASLMQARGITYPLLSSVKVSSEGRSH